LINFTARLWNNLKSGSHSLQWRGFAFFLKGFLEAALQLDSNAHFYTTNAVEGYHRQIRMVTKTKGAFTSDMALLKQVYLATKNIEKNGHLLYKIGV